MRKPLGKILFVLVSVVFSSAKGSPYDQPKAIVSEYYGNPYFENLRALRIPRNSEIVVGETTSQGISKLLFECSASYPVQWIYTGDGIPEIATDTKRGKNTLSLNDFGATLAINQLTESHTGNYTCRGTMNKNSYVSFHLFVPGNNILVSNGGENITYSDYDSIVRIPCSVSHPLARVTLQRSRNGLVSCPLNESLTFNPKLGFLLRVRELYDPVGQYICTASFNNVFRIVSFGLGKRFESNRFSACNPNPCGPNAECLISRSGHTCSCLPGYDGDPFQECRRNIQRESDPCNPSPCGRYGDCVVRNGLATCTCSSGYVGKPPHCTKAKLNSRCVIHQDCSPNELCMERVCTNPCARNKHCGKNADCQVVNRTPICSCRPGTIGDPNVECITDSFKSPYEEQEERLRPECQYDDECPSFLACIHQKCQNPCPSVCGPYNEHCHVIDHKPICHSHLHMNCPPGDLTCLRFRPPMSPPPAAAGGCHRVFCGPNSSCQDMNGQGICSCLPGFTGSPPECTPMCFGHSGCPSHQACQARKCQDPCAGHGCGLHAQCTVKNHKAECECMNGYVGDPSTRCTLVPSTLLQPVCSLRCGRGARCQIINRVPTCRCIDPFDPKCGQLDGDGSCFNDEECSGLQGCFNGQCKNPCNVFRSLCGENQDCIVVNHKAECTCKPGFPLRINNDCFRETAMERSDDFQDDGTGGCQPPFCRRGDPRTENHRCRFSGDCPSSKICKDFHCVEFCDGVACGLNAECRKERSRSGRCVCPAGYFGSPKVQCYPLFRHVMDGGDEGKEIILLGNTNSNDSSNAQESDSKKLVLEFNKMNNNGTAFSN